MALDREKVLQSAQRYAEKKKYDKAILEYQRLLAEDPTDTRTLLKVGDLQSKMQDHAGAIATYDRVATSYAAGGFLLKAIAVYKQIKELLKKHAPELADRYAYITPRLAQIYGELNLVSDALTAWDEVATQLQRAGKEHEAIQVYERTVQLDPTNPLPHLRLAEACCKVQALDPAIQSFWTAAELLLGLKRPDDALKVIERILHFRQEPRFARAAAELYLKRNDKQSGMMALTRLQSAFQANPRDLDTLALLAQSFEVIEQPDKARAVHVEMGKIAREQGRTELWQEIVRHLSSVAPDAPEVLQLIQAGPPAAAAKAPAAPLAPPPKVPTSRPPAAARASIPTVEVTGGEAEPLDLDEDVEYLDDEAETDTGLSDPAASERGPDSIPVGGDDSVLVDVRDSLPAEETRVPSSFHPSAHAHKAVVDAESFRRLGLLDKAVEALHIALEIDPNSVPIREKLREILVDAGEREPAIQETLNIAIIHLHNQEPDLAEPLALEVLDIEPDHPDALHVLAHVRAMYEARADAPADGHLDTFDVEGVNVSRAIDPEKGGAGHLPSFALDEEESRGGPTSRRGLDLSPPSARAGKRPSPEAIEEVLEEAEFFAAQGLYSDAEAILADILRHAPGHLLLQERLEEVRELRIRSGQPASNAPKARETEDRAFDIAASLDALDEIEERPAPHIAGVTEEVDVESVFAKFKEGVKATVAETDAATHYDLGLAYKEMGLLPDAISEFELAGRDPLRTATCYAMVALIHRQTGDLEKAEDAYVFALGAEHKSADEEKGLLYDLALVFEAKGDRASYLVRLQEIAKKDAGYKDVAARIRTLGGSMPQTDNDDAELDAAFDNLFG